jgi:hypothetical protein
MGMTEDDFWSCTPRAFFNALSGFESLRKTDLELQRLQTLFYVNVWAKKPVRDPKLLWVYPWERTPDDEKAEEAAKYAGKFEEKVKRIEERHAR